MEGGEGCVLKSCWCFLSIVLQSTGVLRGTSHSVPCSLISVHTGVPLNTRVLVAGEYIIIGSWHTDFFPVHAHFSKIKHVLDVLKHTIMYIHSVQSNSAMEFLHLS